MSLGLVFSLGNARRSAGERPKRFRLTLFGERRKIPRSSEREEHGSFEDRVVAAERDHPKQTGTTSMANAALKSEEIESFRRTLLDLRARLRGDLEQLTDEALKRNQPDSSGNLSNMPLHMADVGTENYEQEFTLGLIENEQTTLDQIHDALERIDSGLFGRCSNCDGLIAKPRLQALPYAKHCIECARLVEQDEGRGPSASF